MTVHSSPFAVLGSQFASEMASAGFLNGTNETVNSEPRTVNCEP
jgi:hypothetical protein